MTALWTGVGGREWTSEQWEAISRREGDLLVDASAGSGKTSVLVERFARSVLEDGIPVGAILTITFTEKAAAEMRERIRMRLRELEAPEAARETERAPISTIHSFCAGVLRTHALSAGIDPRFRVLDAPEAQRLADLAFDEALEELGQEEPGGLELIAAYGPPSLVAAIRSTYAELRSQGQARPRLPPLGPAPDLEAARARVQEAAAAAQRELGALDAGPARVTEALQRLERCGEVLSEAEPWLGTLGGLALPGGNGPLSGPDCTEYMAALETFKDACAYRAAGRAHRLLDVLLGQFGARYARRKREASVLDFADLELMALELIRGRPPVRARLRERFQRIMVDELQDTNRVQWELIDQLADHNLFLVGDAQQSIYGFRYADVELFEERGRRLEAVGARTGLQTNFRSRPEILQVLNRAFARELGDGFRPLEAAREPAPPEPRVELLVVDKGADWDPDALVSPWRTAEAAVLADRLAELIAQGARAQDAVVLLRATTDMRLYERALEERGVPTYVIGGRGYWAHPQVVDMVAYLRALTNPRDMEAFYTVLVSPLVGVTLDTLVLLAGASRSAGRDPWWVVQEPEGRLEEIDAGDQEKLGRFATWFAQERAMSARAGVERLIDRALERTGYDDLVLGLPGGERRLANLRKLMRLAREQASTSAHPLRDFLDLVRRRSRSWAGDESDGEAPVEGEGLDAVRLMSIHRAKGLEFGIVCVADLGRSPRTGGAVMRVGSDGRFGLRLAQPGTGRREPALDYKALGDERQAAEAREERRLFYVATTRAEERLILSGAAKLDAWPTGSGGGPIGWLGPALVPDLAERAAERRDGEADGVRVAFVGTSEASGSPPRAGGAPAPPELLIASPPAPIPEVPAPAVTELSYSSLEEHRRCGYRFYVERILGVPPVGEAPAGSVGESSDAATEAALSGVDRGILVHALLERLDFRRPVVPDREAVMATARRQLPVQEIEDVCGLVQGFAASPLCRRLGGATSARSEQRFAFLLGREGGLGAVVIRGVFDVIAHEPGGSALVVDYKTDRIAGADPESVVSRSYGTQRLIYALAALRAGARRVEIVHTFLEVPDTPASAGYERTDLPRLEEELGRRSADVLEGRFEVTQLPHLELCHGCPAEGGLCSWPLSMTRRRAPDTLF